MKPNSLVATCATTLCLLTACSTTEKESNTSSTAPKIRLYVFDCGNIKVNDISVFSPGVNEGKSKELTNSCYLIRHPQGDLIWDTGLPDGIGETGIMVMDDQIALNVTHPLTDQLAEINVSPEDIEYVGISHFHSDHTGNANLFNQSTMLIQQEEFDAAFGPKAEQYGFNPNSYSQWSKNNLTVIDGDHDVFGDGHVMIKKAVGHTPGHQMLYINLAKSGPIMLSGDLYHFTSNREHKRVPSFNFSKEATLESMTKIESYVTETGAQFWIQHDKEQNATIRHSPEYYE